MSENQQDQNQEEEKQNKIDLIQVAEQQLKELENKGAQNIITKNEQFITPNGQEGLKTFGTATFALPTGKKVKGEYVILGFTTENLLQQVILIWQDDDVYADKIIDRILNSVELIKLEEDKE